VNLFWRVSAATGASALLGGMALLLGQPQGAAGGKKPDWTAEFNIPRESHGGLATGNANLKSIRVMSWNIDRGTELDLIGSEMTRNKSDLYLLQEVDWNTARTGQKDIASELAQRLHLSFAYGIEFEELSQEKNGRHAFIGQATLTDLPLKRTRILRFERQSGWWKPHGWIPSSLPLMQRRLGNRIALVTELEFRGRPLVVYNLHLESRSYGRIQAAQLDEVLADLASYPPNTSAIIGGDINSKYLPSIFLHKLQHEGFQSALGDRIERTHTIAMALDWIFVRGPLEFESGAVRRDIKGSDHYPVCAELIAK
jgi:endonuclease/exonuclease/phosphatase family metal-dependent hydrolase